MPQNSKHIIAERRAQVAKLYLEGYSQREIAQQLKVNQSQISRDLKILSIQWQRDSKEAIDKIKSLDLAKLAHLERTYHDGWNQSTQEQFVEKSKKTSGVKGKVIKETATERKTLIGDPRFLDGVLKVISKREEILGYAAPSKKSIDANLNIESLSEDQADRILETILSKQATDGQDTEN